MKKFVVLHFTFITILSLLMFFIYRFVMLNTMTFEFKRHIFKKNGDIFEINNGYYECSIHFNVEEKDFKSGIISCSINNNKNNE